MIGIFNLHLFNFSHLLFFLFGFVINFGRGFHWSLRHGTKLHCVGGCWLILMNPSPRWLLLRRFLNYILYRFLCRCHSTVTLRLLDLWFRRTTLLLLLHRRASGLCNVSEKVSHPVNPIFGVCKADYCRGWYFILGRCYTLSPRFV